MKSKFLLAVVALNFSVAVAQQQEGTTMESVWSLKKCVEYALANNLSVKRSEYSVESSSVDFRQSMYNVVPTLNSTVSYGLNWGRSLDPVTYEYTTQELSSINPGLNSGVTLFNGFRIQNTIKQNSRAYAASREDLQKVKNDVMLNIALLYINIIFNKEQLENARFQLASSQTQLERVKKQVAAGALARSEEMNLTAQAANNEVTVVTRENLLNLSLLQLKQALQLPASTPFDVELIDVPIEEFVVDQSRDEIFDIARQTMPEIRSARLRVESSYYAVKAARGSLIPRLTLFGSINSNYSSASDRMRFIPDGGDPIPTGSTPIGYVEGTNQVVMAPTFRPSGRTENGWGELAQLQDNIFKSVGITLSIPLFNNMTARSNVQRSIINNKVTTIAQKEVENTLRQNVENAYNDALASSKTYNASVRLVDARREAFRIMTERYNAGSANSFEFQVSQNDYFQAQSDLTRAKYDFVFRKKVLDFYLGKPLVY